MLSLQVSQVGRVRACTAQIVRACCDVFLLALVLSQLLESILSSFFSQHLQVCLHQKHIQVDLV